MKLEIAMLQNLKRLYRRAGARSALGLAELDFGELVAVLIVMIGLMSFASAGLWSPLGP